MSAKLVKIVRKGETGGGKKTIGMPLPHKEEGVTPF